MQDQLRITEQSLYQIVVSFLLLLLLHPSDSHIHLCGFSDRTVMAQHRQFVGHADTFQAIQTSPDESKAKGSVHSRVSPPPGMGLGQIKDRERPNSSAVSRWLLSATLRHLIGQILRDMSNGVFGRVVSRAPPRLAAVCPCKQGGRPGGHKAARCGGLV